MLLRQRESNANHQNNRTPKKNNMDTHGRRNKNNMDTHGKRHNNIMMAMMKTK